MPDELLQNRYCVAALQQRLSYNVIMTLQSNKRNEQVAPTWGEAAPRRAGARLFRAGPVVVTLLGAGVLVAACGAGSSGHGVASLGKTTTTTGPSGVPSGSKASPSRNALAFAQCMRAHGDTTMPDPVVSGQSVQIKVDPNAPHFTAAYNSCRDLLPNNGVPKITISPADQADYIKAAACMRSHGVTNFPDPVFQDGSVRFQIRSPIDTNSPQYKSALATCQRLIPTGLPYSSTSGS